MPSVDVFKKYTMVRTVTAMQFQGSSEIAWRSGKIIAEEGDYLVIFEDGTWEIMAKCVFEKRYKEVKEE